MTVTLVKKDLPARFLRVQYGLLDGQEAMLILDLPVLQTDYDCRHIVGYIKGAEVPRLLKIVAFADDVLVKAAEKSHFCTYRDVSTQRCLLSMWFVQKRSRRYRRTLVAFCKKELM